MAVTWQLYGGYRTTTKIADRASQRRMGIPSTPEYPPLLLKHSWSCMGTDIPHERHVAAAGRFHRKAGFGPRGGAEGRILKKAERSASQRSLPDITHASFPKIKFECLKNFVRCPEANA